MDQHSFIHWSPPLCVGSQVLLIGNELILKSSGREESWEPLLVDDHGDVGDGDGSGVNGDSCGEGMIVVMGVMVLLMVQVLMVVIMIRS